MHLIENIIKIFAWDSYVCAINAKELKPFMMEKHNWDDKTYKELANIYLTNINRIATDTNLVKLNKADVSGQVCRFGCQLVQGVWYAENGHRCAMQGGQTCH